MKKTYKEPTMLIVTIQHTNLLMQSLENKVGGNADMNYGGGKGNTESRVKENSLWDEEW